MADIRRPIIGVLGVPDEDLGESNIIALFTGYKNAIIEKGGIPFMIVPMQSIDYFHTRLSNLPPLTDSEKERYREMVDLCDGLVIPGGYKIYYWHEYIVRYAIEKNIPILGTCAGLQMLAKIGNGNHIVEEIHTGVNHKVDGGQYVHKVELSKDSILGDICKENVISVNSMHKYHVPYANGFNITARSEDGLIEGIEMPNKNFVVGVQWHPEEMISYDEYANKLFERFSDECMKLKYQNKL